METPIMIIGGENWQNYLLKDYLVNQLKSRCSLCPNFATCVEKIVDCQCRPVLLMDIKSEAFENLEKEMNGNSGEYHLILFNYSHEHSLKKELVDKGVRGVFFETDSPENMLKGICTVSKGEIWFPRAILQKLLFEKKPNEKEPPKKEILSHREKEILAIVSDGLTNPEIADKLCISPNTVRTHVHNIFKKIGVSNRIQAATWAEKNL